MNSLEIARLAARTADDKLGQDITVLDVRGHSALTDMFVFVGATSHLHVGSLEDGIRKILKEAGATLIRTDGQRGHSWRVLDYGDVLIHVMDNKTRQFYGIERLWDEGKKVSFQISKPVKKTKRKKIPLKSAKRKIAKPRKAKRKSLSAR